MLIPLAPSGPGRIFQTNLRHFAPMFTIAVFDVTFIKTEPTGNGAVDETPFRLNMEHLSSGPPPARLI